jgi:hypothetical protein
MLLKENISMTMQTQTFPAGSAPRITITGCQGALNIEFWDQREFAVDSVAGSAISQEDAALVIHDARGDLRLRVPAATEIGIENHQGDLRITTIDGSVRLRDIDGSAFVSGAALLVIERDQLLRGRRWSPLRPRRDVEARDIGVAEIAEVHSNLLMVVAQRATVGEVGGNATVRSIAGDLTVGEVGGNCEVAQVGGDLALRNVGGNCVLENVSGGVRASHVGGNADLRATGPILALGSIGGNLTLADAPLGQEASSIPSGSIAVGGNARVELSPQANLSVDAIVGGSIKGRNLLNGPGMRTIVYGNGAARLRLTVGGNLTLV